VVLCLLLVALTGVVVVVITERPMPGEAIRPAGPLVPESGIFLGAYVELPEVEGGDREQVLTRERHLDRRLRINHHFYHWEEPFPTGMEAWDVEHGRIPLVSWNAPASLQIILSGSSDSWIRAQARRVNDFRESIFLRWAYEMNGDWVSANATHTGRDPSVYVAAWRHLHALFRSEGADNAIWVWCPNYVDSPDERWNHWTRYYPGDDVVDWVGVDAYEWGSTRPGVGLRPLREIVGPVVADYAGRKPIMLAEVGAPECGRDSPCKADWITQAVAWLKTIPAICALVWFDVNKERNWRVDSSPQTLTAYRQLAADPYFS
jgi:hypothetical protein